MAVLAEASLARQLLLEAAEQEPDCPEFMLVDEAKSGVQLPPAAVVWASRTVPLQHSILFARMYRYLPYHPYSPLKHWSRVFEYPWVWLYGNFQPGLSVLDAGGGDNPMQALALMAGAKVTNLDIRPEHLHWREHERMQHVLGDVQDIPLADGSFDRTMCISVLEHAADPVQAVRELYRVTKPGGRLLVTFDLADWIGPEHAIDEHMAARILGVFGMVLPPVTPDVSIGRLAEPEGEEAGRLYHLMVLCFYVTKPAEGE